MFALLLAAVSLSAGDAVPPLNSLELLQTPAGTDVTHQVPHNTPMVIGFWATRCGPCVEQIPRWNALAEKFKARVQFVAITAEDPETVAAFLKQRPMAGWVALDLDGEAHRSYGVETVPRAFLVDAHGTVRAVASISAIRNADLEALVAGRAVHVPGKPGPGVPVKIETGRVPRLLYPFANVRVPYSVRFQWAGVRGAAAYEIQIAEQEEFVDLHVEDTTVYRYLAVDLPVAGPLWWRVRAVNERGEPGPWSVVRKLAIEPPPLAAAVEGINLTPTSVGGGGSVDAVVTLGQGAPVEGATVRLSVSDPALASVPPQVLFPAGEMSARFSVKTTAANGNAEVNIVANSRGEPRLATLRIGPPRRPAALAAVAVHPGVLAAGSVGEGLVTLDEPAPGKTTVRLVSSDATRVPLPPAVTVSAGATGASFAVRPSRSTNTANVTITASLEAAVKTASLDITAADGSEPLPAPVPIAPSYGTAMSYSGSSEFTWSTVTGAASYTIEVATSGSFDSAVISRTLPFPSVTIAPLASGTLWWRVRANDIKGSPGLWSTPRRLRVR